MKGYKRFTPKTYDDKRKAVLILAKTNMTIAKMAEALNVSNATISNLKRHETYGEYIEYQRGVHRSRPATQPEMIQDAVSITKTIDETIEILRNQKAMMIKLDELLENKSRKGMFR